MRYKAYPTLGRVRCYVAIQVVLVACLAMSGVVSAAPHDAQQRASSSKILRELILNSRSSAHPKGPQSASALAARGGRQDSAFMRLFISRLAKGSPRSSTMSSAQSTAREHNCDDLEKIDYDNPTCQNIELIAHCMHKDCALERSAFGDVICGLQAGGCLDSPGRLRLAEILKLEEEPDAIDAVVDLFCADNTGPDLPFIPAPVDCDLLFQTVGSLSKEHMSNVMEILRPIWDMYVKMKCKPCAADLNGVNVYDYCDEINTPPKVNLECECHESGKSVPCFNKQGNTCCAKADQCHSEDESKQPWCGAEHVPTPPSGNTALE